MLLNYECVRFSHTHSLRFLARSAHSAKLQVQQNRLTELPSFTKNVLLELIVADNNQLQRLPDLKANVALAAMYIHLNRLTE